MPNYNKLIEVIISLQVIIVSSLVPVYISIPSKNQIMQTFEVPTSWQIPSIIIITLIFEGEIVIKAFSIYLLIGLFFLPVFQNGGSLGYLLTPNFGYLLGTYPLINFIHKLNKKNIRIHCNDLLKYGILGIFSMHVIGILYSSIQILYFKQSDLLLYNISKYSLGKFVYHLLMLTPITLLIKVINKYRFKNNV
tara:strand:+ start:369 stop:947 length:579 start_codon:yes stop_codon:yes gene_type:complete